MMGETPQYETAKCRSCERAIIWVRSPNGSLLPLDVRPATVYTIAANDSGLVAEKVEHPLGSALFYVSHFLTCPAASTHSKGGRS